MLFLKLLEHAKTNVSCSSFSSIWAAGLSAQTEMRTSETYRMPYCHHDALLPLYWYEFGPKSCFCTPENIRKLKLEKVAVWAEKKEHVVETVSREGVREIEHSPEMGGYFISKTGCPIALLLCRHSTNLRQALFKRGFIEKRNLPRISYEIEL